MADEEMEAVLAAIQAHNKQYGWNHWPQLGMPLPGSKEYDDGLTEAWEYQKEIEAAIRHFGLDSGRGRVRTIPFTDKVLKARVPRARHHFLPPYVVEWIHDVRFLMRTSTRVCHSMWPGPICTFPPRHTRRSL